MRVAGPKLRRQEGFVLIIVMWMLVLLSGIALGMVALVQTDSRLAKNFETSAQTSHIAQAAILRTVVDLLDPEAGAVVELGEARPQTLELFGRTVTVRTADECGKIDLNTGWSGLIGGLFTRLSEREQAVSAAQALLDWRDPDHRRRRQGAEDADYASPGLPYGAGDSLFDEIDEIQLVRGMTPALYSRVEPFITTNCLNAGIDPIVAPAAVLAAVPELAPRELTTFLEARRTAPIAELEALAQSLTPEKKYFTISLVR